MPRSIRIRSNLWCKSCYKQVISWLLWIILYISIFLVTLRSFNRRYGLVVRAGGGGISSSVLSVIFTDKFYKLLKSLHLIGWEQICQWKTLTKCLMKCPPGLLNWWRARQKWRAESLRVARGTASAKKISDNNHNNNWLIP